MDDSVSRIIDNLASRPTHPLYQDDSFLRHRDHLISRCSEQLRILQQKASNLGKHDAHESRAALVLQHIIETMTVAPDESQHSSSSGRRNSRAELVFDKKCVPTIKELASCIHVKPGALEALKKKLKYYLTDPTSGQLGASASGRERRVALTSHTQPGASTTDKAVQNSSTAVSHQPDGIDSTAQFIESLSIRFSSMQELDYNSQRVITSATKLYRDITRFKLYGSKGALHRRSATEYDMAQNHKHYSASCFFITLLGTYKLSNASDKATKKANEQEKERLQQIQQHILHIGDLSPVEFQKILKHVQDIVLEMKKQEQETKQEKKRQHGDQEEQLKKRLALHESGARKPGHREQQPTEKPRTDSDFIDSLKISIHGELEIDEKSSSTLDISRTTRNDGQKDISNTCKLDFLWDRERSPKIYSGCGSAEFQRWKENSIKKQLDVVARDDCGDTVEDENKPRTAKVTPAVVESQDAEEMKRLRRLKELAADNILKKYGF